MASFGATTSNTTLPATWPTHFGAPRRPGEHQLAHPVVEAVLGSSQARLAASAIASAALARSRIREAAVRSRRVGLHGPSTLDQRPCPTCVSRAERSRSALAPTQAIIGPHRVYCMLSSPAPEHTMGGAQ